MARNITNGGGGGVHRHNSLRKNDSSATPSHEILQPSILPNFTAKLKSVYHWRPLARAVRSAHQRKYAYPYGLYLYSHKPIRTFQTTTRIANMAATPLDDQVKSLITKSYPQAQGADSEPVKLSSAIFPTIEVRHPVSFRGGDAK